MNRQITLENELWLSPRGSDKRGWTEWHVRLGRWINDKDLEVRVFHPNSVTEPHIMRIMEHKTSKKYLRGKFLRVEKHTLDFIGQDDFKELREKAEQKVNDIYVGNWFKRQLLRSEWRGMRNRLRRVGLFR
jgi:hypothetical protein